jgi:predicted secreted protein
MSTRFVERSADPTAGYVDTAGNVAPIGVDSDDEKLKFYDRTNSRVVIVEDQFQRTQTKTAAETLTAADSGKVLFLNSGTEFALTLPSPVAGFRLTVIVAAAPTGASYTIVSPAANQIVGNVVSSDLNAAADGDFEAAGANTITLVDAKAVVGDIVEIFCDGTLFYAYARCSVFDAVTFTDV